MRVLAVFCLMALTGFRSVGAEVTETRWMAVFSEGKRVGYIQHSFTVQDDTVTTRVFTALSMDGNPDESTLIAMDETVETGEGIALRFRRETARSGQLTRLTGQIRGNHMHLLSLSEGRKQEIVLDWDPEVLMLHGRRRFAMQKGFAPGTRYQLRQFLPEKRAVADVLVELGETKEVDVLGRTVVLTETRETRVVDGDVLFSKVYFDDRMQVRKVVIPSLDLEMMDAPEAFAVSPPE